MELSQIKILIEKYLEGNTTLQEEIILKKYFSQNDVPSELESYQSVFGYYEENKKLKATKNIDFKNKRNLAKWLSIAASIVVLFGVLFYFNSIETSKKPSNELGTFTDPNEAFIETHKALQMVSKNLNSGMESVQYLEEYEKSKKTIFK